MFLQYFIILKDTPNPWHVWQKEKSLDEFEDSSANVVVTKVINDLYSPMQSTVNEMVLDLEELAAEFNFQMRHALSEISAFDNRYQIDSQFIR